MTDAYERIYRDPDFMRMAAARERMVTVFDADQARQDIRAARERGADIVLVAMHWGGANDTAPTAAQRTAAQALCEAGADIIIGAHSNAVQPVEDLSSAQDTAHSTLVAWSMGTLLPIEFLWSSQAAQQLERWMR